MEANVQELKSATNFVLQLFADQGVILDYSPESIHQLDALFEREFINGIFINGASVFAQYQGLIMTGITGYIAQVILQHTEHARLCFEEEDENWFINFAIESASGKKLMPGHRILKRGRRRLGQLSPAHPTNHARSSWTGRRPALQSTTNTAHRR